MRYNKFMDYQEFINFCSSHPWLKKSFFKFKNDDFEMIKNFCKNHFKNKNEAMIACNRIFLDKRKTKNWTCVMETLSAFISHTFP